MSDYSELKRLAEAIESCTSIPEADESAWMRRATGRAVGELLEELEKFKDEVPKWTEREIKLIAENEKLKADLREVKDAKLGLSWAIGEIMGERDQLKVENESLRKDAERYRWTSIEGNWVARMFGKWRAHVGVYGDAQPTDWYPNREEAIDAAMGKGEQS
jgi:regulator of replication initiation timing